MSGTSQYRKSFTRKVVEGLFYLSLLGVSTPVFATDTVVTIDAREGVSEEIVESYHQAVLSGPKDAPKLIKLYISADTGFDAGWMRVPQNRCLLYTSDAADD